MIICFFPHLFPDFVAHCITPDNLEMTSLNNLPESQEENIQTSNFLSPIQKEAALIAGYTLYWTVVGFRVAFSTCGLIWFYIGSSGC